MENITPRLLEEAVCSTRYIALHGCPPAWEEGGLACSWLREVDGW